MPPTLPPSYSAPPCSVPPCSTSPPPLLCPLLTSRALPSPALPSPALPFLAMPSPSLPSTSLPAPSQPSPSLPSHALPFPALPFPALPSPALPSPALPSPALPSRDLPFPALSSLWKIRSCMFSPPPSSPEEEHDAVHWGGDFLSRISTTALAPFGFTGYKASGSLWSDRWCIQGLEAAAEQWLRHINANLPDHSFFTMQQYTGR
ncbi:unnamed protein product [Closterium sp. Naga37s-1]|nr:unnamed protein product [Closterium sp. Naga37s-1]